MHEVKIKNFEALHPGTSFPRHRHLDVVECELLRATMASNLRLAGGSTALEILQALEARAIDIQDVMPSEESFCFAELFRRLQLESINIYVNWSSFDDIDEMALTTFSDAFDDLWYPSSDDIEIFDQSQKWVLLVRHFDVVQIVRM
jgi:hypothetical protein